MRNNDRQAHPRTWIALSAALACAVTAFVAPRIAEAKSQRDSRYLYQQVWPAAVRLLRVDAGYKILEKDFEAGYVLFEVSEDRKRFRGSLQLVRLDSSNSQRVRVIINIADRPSYVAVGLLDRLERKLREEYGPPPKTQPKSPDMDARY